MILIYKSYYNLKHAPNIVINALIQQYAFIVIKDTIFHKIPVPVINKFISI